MLSRFCLVSAITLVPGLAVSGDMVELTFVDHIKAGMIEQDVYVDKMSDGKLYRVTTEEADDFKGAKVFRTSQPVKHAPMDASKLGPYEAGGEFDFTLGTWLSATGKGQYTCDGESGTLATEFEGLVPNGLYTMWNFFAGNNLAQFHTYDLPMGAPDGSEAAFSADEKGHATYQVNIKPCLQGSTDQLMAGLAIAYHSDGETHGYEPGPMGNKSHVHLFTALPADAEMPRQ